MRRYQYIHLHIGLHTTARPPSGATLTSAAAPLAFAPRLCNSAWEAPSGRQPLRGPATRVARAGDSSERVAMYSQNRKRMKPKLCIGAHKCLGSWCGRGRGRSDWLQGSRRALEPPPSRPAEKKTGAKGDGGHREKPHPHTMIIRPLSRRWGAAQCLAQVRTASTRQRGAHRWTDAVLDMQSHARDILASLYPQQAHHPVTPQ